MLSLTRHTSSQHNIDAHAIPAHVKTVVDILTEHGYQAYCVGGCVRDLLAGKTPKDFDIATDGHPEEIVGLFERSRIIGRRFRLVHVVFGRQIVEVATFRGQSTQKRTMRRGKILYDNAYGTLEDDVLRRDFTCNALYYCPRTETILDFVDGVDDIRQRVIRLIGDAKHRFPEDPVRMLRALRFQAKLGATLEKKTQKGLKKYASLLKEVSPARLFEEMIKLFHSGFACALFEPLQHYQVLARTFPVLYFKRKKMPKTTEQFVLSALQNTDERLQSGKSVTPAFLIAVLLWDCIQETRTQHADMPPRMALEKSIREVIQAQQKTLSIPKRLTEMATDVWFLQFPLEVRRPKRIHALLEHRRFRAAYDFLLLRAQRDKSLQPMAQWWTDIQTCNTEERQQMINKLKRT